jgi:hypothetical protein
MIRDAGKVTAARVNSPSTWRKVFLVLLWLIWKIHHVGVFVIVSHGDDILYESEDIETKPDSI